MSDDPQSRLAELYRESLYSQSAANKLRDIALYYLGQGIHMPPTLLGWVLQQLHQREPLVPYKTRGAPKKAEELRRCQDDRIRELHAEVAQYQADHEIGTRRKALAEMIDKHLEGMLRWKGKPNYKRKQEVTRAVKYWDAKFRKLSR